MLQAILVSVLPIVLVATFPGRVDHSEIADLPGANLSAESITGYLPTSETTELFY